MSAKQKILKELYGTHEDSFEKLPRLFFVCFFVHKVMVVGAFTLGATTNGV